MKSGPLQEPHTNRNWNDLFLETLEKLLRKKTGYRQITLPRDQGTKPLIGFLSGTPNVFLISRKLISLREEGVQRGFFSTLHAHAALHGFLIQRNAARRSGGFLLNFGFTRRGAAEEHANDFSIL